ncbi:MAG: hypothetical protein ACTSWY_10990 [Promethearchaeota archaeon]
MEDSRVEISFRVNFFPTADTQESDMRLTFFGNKLPYSIEKEINLLPLINNTVERTKSGYNISNIKDVIPNSEKYNIKNFKKFIVLLFGEGGKDLENHEITRKGILLGDSKENGIFILGIWPYHYFLLSDGNFKMVLEAIIKTLNSQMDLTNIILIYEK